jgi:putative DNA primase/helicase
VAAYQSNPDTVAGIGFVFTANDPFAGIDLDHCISEDGTIHPAALELVQQFDTYTEKSPSGLGLHLLIRGTVVRPGTGGPGGRGRLDGVLEVEVYSARRYFTFTGDRLAGTPATIEVRQEQLNHLLARLWPNSSSARKPPPGANSQAHDSSSLSDDALLDRARNAKNGEKFRALFDRGDISAHKNNWSCADEALCCLLAYQTNCDADRIERLFNRSKLVRDKWTNREDYRRQTIAKAIQFVAKSRADERRKQLPVIQITTDMSDVVDQAEQAICSEAKGQIYQRGDTLVHVLNAELPGSKPLFMPLIRAPNAPRIMQLEHPRLRELMSSSAAFEVLRGGQGSSNKKWGPALPPDWVVKVLAARRQWMFQYLGAIAEAPFLRPDGTIVTVPGFDEASSVLYVPQPGLVLPPFPERPSREDAAAALAVLEEPFCDFRFVSPADKSAVIAAILTGLGRVAIPGPTPLFGLGATVRGSGKGLLGQSISYIVTGHRAATYCPAAAPDELRKFLLAAAIGCDPAVLLDNIEGAFGSPHLAAALTSCVIEDRILGETRNVSAPLSPLWLATGNGLRFIGDLGRRVVLCEQDPGCEHPEDRTDFTHKNLLEYVRNNRGRFVVAGLTILRAHALAGRPGHGGARKGSFEDWDDVVRSAIVWAGGTDPLGNVGRLREQSDQDVALIRETHEAWWQNFNISGGTVAMAIHLAEQVKGDKADDKAAILMKAALTGLDPRGGGKTFNPQTIGNRISAIKGRIVYGRRFVPVGETRGSTIWKVEEVGPKADHAGNSVPIRLPPSA